MTLEKLNNHFETVRAWKEARERLETMRARILGSPQLDGIPHTISDDRIGNLVIALEMQERDVEQLEAAVKDQEAEIIRYVEMIRDNHTKVIFSLRFISGCTWDEVACLIGGGNTGQSVKMICYRYLKKSATKEATLSEGKNSAYS